MQLEDYLEFLSDDDIRIKGHRLGIDKVLEPFLNGFVPETIAQDYPELSLEKIYATITYYFFHKGICSALGRVSQKQKGMRQYPHPKQKSTLILHPVTQLLDSGKF